MELIDGVDGAANDFDISGRAPPSVFDERGAVHEAGAYALVPAPLPSASISSSRPPNPNAILSRDASQCLPHGKSS